MVAGNVLIAVINKTILGSVIIVENSFQFLPTLKWLGILGGILCNRGKKMVEGITDVLLIWAFSGLASLMTYIFLTLRLHRYGYSWKKIMDVYSSKLNVKKD